jgi:hypothetical protein
MHHQHANIMDQKLHNGTHSDFTLFDVQHVL